MIISLPSLEAPKNYFLVGYLLARLISEAVQYKEGVKLWGTWDTLFATIVFTALLSTLFSGFTELDEWRGYGVLLTSILTGWFISRTHYTNIQYQLLFKIIVLSTLPPLIWGLYEYFVIHSKTSLEIHSVGHVNHSAIYLAIISGSSLAWFLSQIDAEKKITSGWQPILIGTLSFVFLMSLIIGLSRGAFGIAALLSIILFLLLPKKKNVKILGVMSILSIFIFMLVFNAPIAQKQITNQKNNNMLAFRDRVWNVSLEASRLHPFLGIGIGNWKFINYDHLKKLVEERGETFDSDRYFFPGHSHNLYLTALVERGILGLTVTIIFMVAWIRQLIKTFRWAKKSNETIYLWAGSFSAWFCTFGIGLVNTTFHHEHGILACLFLGLYLSYKKI